MQKMHTTCETLSQSAQKGTIARAWDMSPGMCLFIGACVMLALVLGASLVALAMHDRKVAQLRNKRIPMARKVRTMEVKTRNFRNVR